MARWCTACAAEREGKFCQDCGAQLVDKVATCACGYTLPDGAKFCPECGRSVLAAAPPQAEQAEPAHNPLRCPHCHSEQDDENWRFCVVCGERRSEFLSKEKASITKKTQPDKKKREKAPASERNKQAKKRIAACNNNAEDLYRLGKQFIDEKNKSSARECFARAADRGHLDAKINLLYIQEK